MIGCIMNDFEWRQLSQWDFAPDGAYIEYKDVSTGISKGACRFMLVKREVIKGDHVRLIPVDKNEVTFEMLNAAGKP